MDTDVLYSAEQIRIPSDLAAVLKAYTKEIMRVHPHDVARYSANYFAERACLPLPYPDIVMGKSAAARAKQITLNQQKLAVLRQNASASSSVLSRAQLETLFAQFKTHAASDGTLTRSAFERAVAELLALPPSVAANLHAMYDVFDTDRSGRIAFDEFVCGVGVLLYGDARDQMGFSFKLMDRNGDGRISKEEFLAFFRKHVHANYVAAGVGAEFTNYWNWHIRDYLLQQFHAMDADASGFIDMVEFVADCNVASVISQYIGELQQVDASKLHDKEKQYAGVESEAEAVPFVDQAELLDQLGAALRDIVSLDSCNVQ
jgi:Ca2+-binding EF-hand superfamily protein